MQISLAMLRLRTTRAFSTDFTSAQSVVIDEDQMRTSSGRVQFRATRQASNSSWFDKLEVEKAIAKAMNCGYNVCFFVSGRKGTGKDFCVHGGVINPLSAFDQEDV